MIDLILAAAMLQAADPCLAVTPNPPPATCPGWRPLFIQEGRQMFYDPASVRRTGDTFEIRQRAVLPVALRGAWTIILAYRFDCRARTLTGLSGNFYDARGMHLREFIPEGANAAAQPIPPGAPFETILTEFCPTPAAPRG